MTTALAVLTQAASEHLPGGLLGKWTLSTILLRPLGWLYLEGPRAWGFWGGATLPDICAQLTNTRAQFWTSEPGAVEECAHIVQRHYWSYVVLVSSASYAVTIIWLIRYLCQCASKKTPPCSNLKNG